MPTYLTVTSNTHTITVYFNDAAGLIPADSGGARKANIFPFSSISYFTLNSDASAIYVYVDGGGEWRLDMNGIKGLPVTSVNGVTITDNEHLFTELSKM